MQAKIIEEIPFKESTIETIDTSFFRYVEDLNIFSLTNSGFERVSVVWSDAERSFIAKRNREERDAGGTLNFPIIVIERSGISKDPQRKGTAYGNVPHVNDAKGGAASIIVARRIKQDKTGNFANANALHKRGQLNFPKKNKKVVYETISIPMPVYISSKYTIKLKADYQQQMNDMIQVFTNKTGGINYFAIKYENHLYEGFIGPEFTREGNTSAQGTEIRKFQTNIEIEILGYLVGNGVNQEQPKIIKRENAVEFKIPREHVVLGDAPDHKGPKDVYYGMTSLDDT